MRFNELPWRGTSSGPRPRAPHPTSEKKRQKEGRGRLDSPRIKPPPASQHLLFPPNLHRLPTARQFPPYTSSHQHTHNKETRFTNYWLTKANDATMKYKTNIKDYLDLEGSISHSFFFNLFISSSTFSSLCFVFLSWSDFSLVSAQMFRTDSLRSWPQPETSVTCYAQAVWNNLQQDRQKVNQQWFCSSNKIIFCSSLCYVRLNWIFSDMGLFLVT